MDKEACGTRDKRRTSQIYVPTKFDLVRVFFLNQFHDLLALWIVYPNSHKITTTVQGWLGVYFDFVLILAGGVIINFGYIVLDLSSVPYTSPDCPYIYYTWGHVQRFILLHWNNSISKKLSPIWEIYVLRSGTKFYSNISRPRSVHVPVPLSFSPSFCTIIINSLLLSHLVYMNGLLVCLTWWQSFSG